MDFHEIRHWIILLHFVDTSQLWLKWYGLQYKVPNGELMWTNWWSSRFYMDCQWDWTFLVLSCQQMAKKLELFKQQVSLLYFIVCAWQIMNILRRMFLGHWFWDLWTWLFPLCLPEYQGVWKSSSHNCRAKRTKLHKLQELMAIYCSE
jgi:hypothetical protein